MDQNVLGFAVIAVLSSGISAIVCPPKDQQIACLVNPCMFKKCPFDLKCVNDACEQCSAFCVKEGQCVVDGTIYNSGESFPAADGCNTCTCSNGNPFGCTKIACKKCHVGGQTFNPGQVFLDPTSCNTCFCRKSGHPSCTKIYCPLCRYNGNVYKPGQTFPSSDGCNTCSCSERGTVSCTEKACDPVCPKYKCKPCSTGYVIDENGCQTCQCKNPQCEGVACEDDQYCNGGICCPKSDFVRFCPNPCLKKDCGLLRVCKRVCACDAKCILPDY